jgi:hypothetical protein
MTNGEAAAGTLRRAGLDGEVLGWSDLLWEGPLAAADDAQFLELRARYLASAGYAPLTEARDQLAAEADKLATARRADELVLWFEHDLHDQVQLVYLLGWLARQAERPGRLSLISIDRFPGVIPFHGLGQLRPDQLASLYPSRITVEADVLSLAELAWASFTAPGPEALNRLLTLDRSPLPFLPYSIRRYLEEYPAIATGLSRTEGAILGVLERGPGTVKQLFRTVQATEEAVFMGDRSFWRVLRGLAREPAPLISFSEEPAAARDLVDVEVALAPAGREVLSRGLDWVALAGIDRWHGGVHLAGRQIAWRWHPGERRVVPLATRSRPA